jgi:hypothetical protein
MEPANETGVRPVWLKRKAQRSSSSVTRANRANQILSEQRTETGELLGPYETVYDLSSGYGVDRVIIRP